MKYLLIAFALFALARGQEDMNCNCGAFVSTSFAEMEVHMFPPTEIEDCKDEKECAKICTEAWDASSDGGNLDFELESGELVGQVLCNFLLTHHHHPNLPPHDVYLYYNLCSEPWIFDGQTSQQKLCCEDGEYPGDC